MSAYCGSRATAGSVRSEEHTSELQSPCNLVCRLLLEKKKGSEPAHRDPERPGRCRTRRPLQRRPAPPHRPRNLSHAPPVPIILRFLDRPHSTAAPLRSYQSAASPAGRSQLLPPPYSPTCHRLDHERQRAQSRPGCVDHGYRFILTDNTLAALLYFFFFK